MPAKFSLPPLPFEPTALAPAISADTFAQHHAGHHKAYVDKLNALADEHDFTETSLLEIIRETADVDPEDVSEQVSAGDIFVHAAQHFNHSFYWKSLSADGGEPTGELLAAIERDFGSVEALKKAIVDKGVDHFASGWVWLVSDDGKLELLGGHDAQTPVIDEDLKPVLVLDVWEHAYYLDHQRARKAYLDAVTAKHLNWAFAAEAYAAESVEDLGLGIGNG
ncbi:superoxide dismutase [Sandaracinobacter neustonicus]|uniref:Superoxide dismutase n=1 Tax=Sandaracinobacter neustonicus TaxID=1715348 RepID=A0A501XFY2_9SPHN|nr:superoxide dismutase [Sandaracinobacter neustonicus]TPE59440.1 superoxide dismutase [Sandaracinobacter neustonicus]